MQPARHFGAMHFAFLGFCKGRTNKLKSMEIKLSASKFDFTQNSIYISGFKISQVIPSSKKTALKPSCK
jgi:hypothetical protein